MSTVASLTTYSDPTQTNSTAYAATVTTPSGTPVAMLTATGVTSTEGVDMLTYTTPIEEGGLYKLYAAICVTTVSNAGTSHVAAPVIQFTTQEGTGVVGANVANMEPMLITVTGNDVIEENVLDMKTGRSDGTVAGYGWWEHLVSVKGGTSIVIKISHTVAGTVPTTGKYALDFAIVKL